VIVIAEKYLVMFTVNQTDIERRRAAALQDVPRKREPHRQRASVLECASPVALFGVCAFRWTLLAAIVFAVFVSNVQAQPAAGIIPAPTTIKFSAGQFSLDGNAKIICRSREEKTVAKFLSSELKSRKTWELPLAWPSKKNSGGILLELNPRGKFPAESYSLTVASNGVALRAATSAGLFYAAVSLLQMVDANSGSPGSSVSLPAVSIADAPRYEWRGFMLDESDHFYGKQTVLELLDVMAYLKMNRFHWHLTDDYGWRVEIRRYPKLTQIGASRDWSETNTPPRFYSQKEIREIVAYASARHIVIVPEVDMPGHITSATLAYPEISEGGTGRWKGFTVNPAKPETYVFLKNVLRELCGLFPGPYLHLGGDEVWFGNQPWSTDPQIVKFTRDHGMTNAVQLEGYFIRRMTVMIHDLGRTPLGWDEITPAGASPDYTAIMWWRHNKTNVVQQALAENYRVVLCPRLPCYLDHIQDGSQKFGRRFEGKFITLDDAYRFPEPLMDSLIPAGREKNILGIEACQWTEFIPDRARLDYMTLPRLAAIAEDAWTPAARKNLEDFRSRTTNFLRELDRRKIPYYNPFNPAATPEPPGCVKQNYKTPPSQ
jgi:hexosaminidase